MELKARKKDAAFNELTVRIAHVFASEAGLRTAKQYIQGLMSPLERKNGWQLAEATGDTTPYAIQQFLYRGQFSADRLLNELRGYVNEKLGDEDGVLVVDETGFLKQGKMSCGVKRQSSCALGFTRYWYTPLPWMPT